MTNLVWDWRNEIINYLEQEKLPEDSKASRALRAKAARYSFKGGHLYRKSFHGPLARCLGASKSNYVMREVHEWICVNHSRVDSLVLKLVWPGYYWPRIEEDAKAFVQKCDKCQHYALLVHQPAEQLHSVLYPWSSMKWGMDIFGPLSSAPALIPVEVGECTLRYFQASEEPNNEAMLVNLELLDECRNLAHIRMAAQKKKMERYYNRRANLRYLKVGDLVLRKVTQNTRELNAGKLGQTWEGPYRTSAVTGKGSYELENQDGEKLPSNWNVAHLKRYYC
uniref:Integrase zinc-binding domain-containing protein n=1 Tax=Nicotiana tabacum TaxID=4097 RepID=A0A1S3XDV3_TOBAC|nr:PREDICTED: uncharacterized protein LOC107764018 [Nicotiana tabacum]